MTYQNILRWEGHPGSDDAHPKTQPKQKESLCCVWVYISIDLYLYAVCVREKRRFVQYHKSQAIQLKTRYKKSVEVQGRRWGGGTKSYLACRSIPVKLDRR